MPKFVAESTEQDDRRFAIRQAEATLSGNLSRTRHVSITPWKTNVSEIVKCGTKYYVARVSCKAVPLR